MIAAIINIITGVRITKAKRAIDKIKRCFLNNKDTDCLFMISNVTVTANRDIGSVNVNSIKIAGCNEAKNAIDIIITGTIVNRGRIDAYI